jgi:hypothetical protein
MLVGGFLVTWDVLYRPIPESNIFQLFFCGVFLSKARTKIFKEAYTNWKQKKNIVGCIMMGILVRVLWKMVKTIYAYVESNGGQFILFCGHLSVA